MISITFPIAKENIKGEVERITTEITTRNAELRVLQTMLQTVRSLCSHEFPNKGYLGTCIHCGHYVGSGD